MPYGASSRLRMPTSMKNGCAALILPVATKVPIALSTPGARRNASMSCLSSELSRMSDTPRCETVKSALPVRRIDTAVWRSEYVRTPSVMTAVTPIATASAVTAARKRRRSTLCASSPRKVTRI